MLRLPSGCVYEQSFDIEIGYSFAGWYSQSYNRKNNTWSNFELVTTSMNEPFITAATADTNIVAVFVALSAALSTLASSLCESFIISHNNMVNYNIDIGILNISFLAFLVAQLVKNSPAMQETQV